MTLTTPVTRTQNQGGEVQWMHSRRCTGGSECQIKLCSKTECLQASPDTLPLWGRQRREEGEELFLYYCARHSNTCQWTPDSMTSHSIQAYCHHGPLSVLVLCKSLQYQLLLHSPLPSSSDQSDQLYTAAGSTSRICPGVQDTAACPSTASLFGCSHTGGRFCELCLGPMWVHKYLTERKRQ